MVALYTLAVFVSALLLFSVQPHVGKVLLPVMGGTPAVWNTCMLFFQGALLVGYGYAHLTSRWLDVRRQGVLHLVLLVAAFGFLPLSIQMSSQWSASPTWPLLVALTTSVGLPFVINSTSAPLLQRWFSETDHPGAANPYPLYASSNVGSLLALLVYPFVVERWLSVSEQAVAHAWVFGGLGLLVAGCLGVVWRRLKPPMQASEVVERPGWALRGQWLVMSFVPSSLLLGVTMALTLDVAAVPMLWVVPLAIYILSFVLAFARRAPPHRPMVWLYPMAVVALAPILITRVSAPIAGVALAHLVVFFLACMAFHGELNRTKPHPAHLTEFYLLMSVGGVLGGVFNALVAPAIFDTVIEYPVVLVLSVAALVIPVIPRVGQVPYAVVALTLVGSWSAMVFGEDTSMVLTLLAALAPVLLLGIFWRPQAFRWGVPVTFAVLWIALSQNTREVLFEERGYFGVSTVVNDTEQQVRLLYHGTTNHGGQSTLKAYERWMVPYHYPGSPVGQAWKSVSRRKTGFEVAALGLGSGGLACMAAAGEKVVFFEIDPVVERLARDASLFTFLRDCPADVVMGDGRLMMDREPAGRFGLVVVDVFGSDALPVHLFTREAVGIYADKLSADGLMVFHISSRFTDLTPMLAAMAEEMGWVWRVQMHRPPTGLPVPLEPTRGFVMARDEAGLGDLARDSSWVAPDGRVPAWTDQRADLFSVMRL